MIHPVKSAKNHVRRHPRKYKTVAAAATTAAAYASYCAIGWKSYLADPEAFDAKHS
jgi:hypothetical protein